MQWQMCVDWKSIVFYCRVMCWGCGLAVGLCEAVGLAACGSGRHVEDSSAHTGVSGRELHSVLQASS